jgi:hypothetical protein
MMESPMMESPELQSTLPLSEDKSVVESVVTISTVASSYNRAGKQDLSQEMQIRSRLLNRLGIYDSGASSNSSSSAPQPMTAAQQRRVRISRGMGVGYTMFTSPPDGSATRSPLGNVMPFTEELKTSESSKSPRNSPPQSKSNTKKDDASNNASKTTRIAFQEEVEVMTIPTRHEYSDRIKSRIWSNRHELQENAERNAVEFASEGWNWRTVTEDEGMYICSASGELVHPAWVGDNIPQTEPEPEAQVQQQEEEVEEPPTQSRLERGGPAHSS